MKCIQCGSKEFQAIVIKSGSSIVDLVPDDGNEDYGVDYIDVGLEPDIEEIFCKKCRKILKDHEWEIHDDDMNKGIFRVRPLAQMVRATDS